MNETDTRVKKIDPRLHEAGWEEGNIIREYAITPGRIERIRHAKPKKADYLLCYQNRPLAVVEAKGDEHDVAEGVEQAKAYARMLHMRFAYSTNGDHIYFIDMGVQNSTGKYTIASTEFPINRFHAPQELWRLLFPTEEEGWRERFAKCPLNRDGNREPRYYQQNAINAVLDAIAEEKKRILLTMATGTGKTYTAFQICWKLFQTQWNKDYRPNQQPKILFIADRNILADQACIDFAYFPEDAIERIKPRALQRAHGQVPQARSLYFTIFQTFMTLDATGEPYYRQYPADFFDLVIIDECHRGGANDESQWREILEYFAPAYQLGLTATPKRKVNANTYNYFGDPVYSYSLKQGIEDGFLTPFRVRISQSKIDQYTYDPADDVEGDIDPDKTYTEQDFYRGNIRMRERDEHRVKELLEQIDPNEKTIVFCATQLHAMVIRDLINQHKKCPDNNYCQRVTADDGAEGEAQLRAFQDNENLRPTILTTSQKLSTGVDARNVRNIVLLRPVNNMVEFKQIIGRGTRLFDNKYYFTIYDFVGASKNFEDPDWDGDVFCPICSNNPCTCSARPRPPRVCPVCGNSPCTCPTTTPQPCPVCGQLPCVCPPKKKVVVRLSESRKARLLQTEWTERFQFGDELISPQEFFQRLYGRLPEFFQSEQDLREQWADPTKRTALLNTLEENGFAEEKLEMLRHLLEMEDYDLLDVLEYVGWNIPGLERKQRAEEVSMSYVSTLAPEQQEFFSFVLNYYVRNGYKELSGENLGRLIQQKYTSAYDALRQLNVSADTLRNQYFTLQRYLYLLTA